MIFRKDIINSSISVGFDLCGVTSPRLLTSNIQNLNRWIEQGNIGGLDYMRRYMECREDITKLFEGAKSVVVCAVSYKSTINEGYTSDMQGKVASYACNRDYHKSIKKMLLKMLKHLQERYPSLNGRAFTDSAPLFEKQLAVDAGLGWIGRQSLLVTPKYGTYVLLGELILDSEVDSYDQPLMSIGCGECRRCIDACPNAAINEELTIDTRRCISCQTIERSNDNNTPLHGWIFGCDECQMCCPYNKQAPQHTNRLFDPIFNPCEITREEWLTMSEEIFLDRFGTTPMRRSGLQRIKDNI